MLCFVLIFAYGQNPFAIAGVVVNVIFAIMNILPAKSMINDGYNMKNIGITKEIDTLGRLQIPKNVRERLGLSREVELLITSDGILIRSSEYKLVKIEKGTEK